MTEIPRERRGRRARSADAPAPPPPEKRSLRYRSLENPFPPIEILSADQVAQLHASALTVLEQDGIRVLLPEACSCATWSALRISIGGNGFSSEGWAATLLRRWWRGRHPHCGPASSAFSRDLRHFVLLSMPRRRGSDRRAWRDRRQSRGRTGRRPLPSSARGRRPGRDPPRPRCGSRTCAPLALGRTETDVDDRRRHEARAAGILHRDLDAELDGHVAVRSARVIPPTRWSFRGPVGNPVAVRPQQVVERLDRLVEDAAGRWRAARRRTRRSYGTAARMCIEVAGCPQEASRATGGEGAVRVGEQRDVGPTAPRTAASRSASASGAGRP